MTRHLAHLLRRTARKLIAWSNRLDGPTVVPMSATESDFEPFRADMDLSRIATIGRGIGRAGQEAGRRFGGLMEPHNGPLHRPEMPR